MDWGFNFDRNLWSYLISEHLSSFPVKLIQNSPNLHVFHLKCNFLSNCEPLMTVLASCKKLREIEFSGRCFEAMTFGKKSMALTSHAPVHKVITYLRIKCHGCHGNREDTWSSVRLSQESMSYNLHVSFSEFCPLLSHSDSVWMSYHLWLFFKCSVFQWFSHVIENVLI